MSTIVLITNNAAPYREKVHELVSKHFDNNYHVIYCTRSEPNRNWVFTYGNYNKIFLGEKSKGEIHNNPRVVGFLNKLNPDIIITTGFGPTMMYAFLWATLRGRKHITFTDGTLKSEKSLSYIHSIFRKIVFSKTQAFIGSSNGTKDLYISYGIPVKYFFKSCLAIENALYQTTSFCDKKFDIMFSGQLIDRKMPFFFIEVAKTIKEMNGSCRVLILGGGILKNKMERRLKEYNINYEYPGLVDQKDLPNFYPKTKVFLFPSRNDPWGVVANEAMASGVPVMTCENTGAAGDLILDNINGFILPLDVTLWAAKAIEIINSQLLYEKLSAAALLKIQEYNFENAAEGIIEAIKSVL